MWEDVDGELREKKIKSMTHRNPAIFVDSGPLIVPSQNRARLRLEMPGAFNQFVNQRTVLLTTYRRDGTPVGTPVNIVVDGDRAFVRTFDTAWKLKRIRKNPIVEIAPSTVSGKLTQEAYLVLNITEPFHSRRKSQAILMFLKIQTGQCSRNVAHVIGRPSHSILRARTS